MRAEETGQGDLSGSEPSWASNISEDISIYKQTKIKVAIFVVLFKNTADSRTGARPSWQGCDSALETAVGCGWLCHHSHTDVPVHGAEPI